jgi:hypothetical protein
MKDDNDDMNYSIDYLRKYLNGELTDKEMQALEKAALEDPFLSDAIDGLREAGNISSFESDVAELRNRLNKRVQKEKKKRGIIFMFPRWQVAASILVIVAITTLTITTIKNTSTQKSISSVNKKDTQHIIVYPAPAVVQTNSDTITAQKNTESPPVAKNVEQNKPTAADRSRKKTSIAFDEEKDKKSIATIPQVNVSPGEKEELKKDDTQFSKQGVAMNDSGKAIASAPARLSARDKVARTDTNSIGQLNEVVVTGYAAQKKRDVTGSVTNVTNNAHQPSGWLAMYNYINENKKINSADSVLKGEEVVSFELNKKGKISSIKVIKSISPAHDAEVIRLLKSGPPIIPANGKEQTCKIGIVFN